MRASLSFLRSAIVGAGLLAAALVASSAELPYTQPAFDAALAGGKPVIVDFAASWCPTCKTQKPLVDSLMQDPKRQPLTLLKADFDTESALKQRLKVTMQSTFVVFKDGKEVARSTGQTDKAALAALFDKAL